MKKALTVLLVIALVMASLFANGGTNSAHNLSTKSLLDDGEPSMSERLPVRNIIDGT